MSASHSLKPQHLENDRNHHHFLTRKDLKELDDIKNPNKQPQQSLSGKFSHTSPQI
jgi:hypothetical protein